MRIYNKNPWLNQRMVFIEMPGNESFTSKTERLIGAIPKRLDIDVETGRDNALNLVIEAREKIEDERKKAAKKVTPETKTEENKYVVRINKAAKLANEHITRHQEDYLKIEAIIASQCTSDLARKSNQDFLSQFGSMDPAAAITESKKSAENVASLLSDIEDLQMPSILNPRLWEQKVKTMQLSSEGLVKSYEKIEGIVWYGIVNKLNAKDIIYNKIAASNEEGEPPILSDYRILKKFADELDAIAKPFEDNELLAEYHGIIMAKKEEINSVVHIAAGLFAGQDESFKTMNDSLNMLRAEFIGIKESNPEDPRLTDLASAIRAMRATMNPWADRIEKGQPLNEFPQSDIPKDERIDLDKSDDFEKIKAVLESKDALIGQIERWNNHKIICPISAYRELRDFRNQVSKFMSTTDGAMLRYVKNKKGRMNSAMSNAADLIAHQDKHFKMLYETLKQLRKEYDRLEDEDPKSPQLNEKARAIVNLGKHLDAWAERLQRKGHKVKKPAIG